MADAQGGSEFGKVSAKRCGMLGAFDVNISLSAICTASPTILAGRKLVTMSMYCLLIDVVDSAW